MKIIYSILSDLIYLIVQYRGFIESCLSLAIKNLRIQKIFT